MKPATRPSGELHTDPSAFLYERLDGRAVYYRGYRQALASGQTPETVMGSGRKQAYLIDLILGYLKATLDRGRFATAVSEPGIQLNKHDFVACDLVVYRASDKVRMLANTYFDFPPLVAIEVDTKADLEAANWESEDYYRYKSERLLRFGLKKVIWIFSENRTLHVYEPGRPPAIARWEDEVEVLPGCVLHLQRLIEADGVDWDV